MTKWNTAKKFYCGPDHGKQKLIGGIKCSVDTVRCWFEAHKENVYF